MKTLLQIIIVGLCAWGIISLDVCLYDWIISLIPHTEWIGLIKVVIVLIMIIYTSGIVIALIALASAIALLILDAFIPSKNYNNSRWWLQKPKSRFQQKLDNIRNKRNKTKLN